MSSTRTAAPPGDSPPPVAGSQGDPRAALAYLAGVDTLDKARAQLRRQAVRDARTAGAQITEIASTLGIRNRAGVYEILNETPLPPPAALPTPAVFVRGARVSAGTWAEVIDAMHLRGWTVVRDRTQAWHLARARVPVVLVDISASRPSVGLVRARHGADQQLELPHARPATHLEALDVDELALAVINQLTAVLDVDEDQEAAAGSTAATPATGVSTTRSMSLPATLWDQVQQAVNDGRAASTQPLIAKAVDQLMGKLERKNGGPFPPVDRLPTGQRPRPVRGQVMRPWKITLDQAVWARARAVVAGSAATSLPALITRALQEYLAAA